MNNETWWFVQLNVSSSERFREKMHQHVVLVNGGKVEDFSLHLLKFIFIQKQMYKYKNE